MGRSHDLLTLFRLARLHWRAGFRKQFRRMRSPSGCVFGLLGILLIIAWLGLMVFGPGREGVDWGPQGNEAELQMFLVQAFLGAFGFLSLMGAFNAKGLYLPKSELHTLLSAPISTSDLVRYRLFVDGGKTALSGIIFVALFWGRLPSPGYGIFGILLALFAITVLGRMFSLALGNTNLRLGRFFSGRALGRIGFSIGMILWAAMVGLLVSTDVAAELFGGSETMSERMTAAAEAPLVIAILSPLRPFAELVVAETVPQFLTWLAVDVTILIVLFELCARSVGEIREATLTTSEALAKRIGAMRKGHSGLAAMGRAERKEGARVRRLPRVFGQGKWGTVAWAQLVGITRFSLATTLIGFVVVGFLVMLTVNKDLAGDLGPPDKEVAISTAIIVVIGTMYLGTSMRFDFRTSLTRMESLKSWPLSASRLFSATVLPQALIMTLLLLAGVLSRLALTGVYQPVLLKSLALIPAFVYAWVALDNAVFLCFPVKFIPGQDGAVHHMGRSILLLLLRVILLTGFGVILAGTLFLLSLLSDFMGMGAELVENLGFWLVLFGILVAGALFSRLGGLALSHYDVSKSVS